MNWFDRILALFFDTIRDAADVFGEIGEYIWGKDGA